MNYAIILDSNGNATGAHFYAEAPVSYPSNEVACTQSQAANPAAYMLSGGVLTENLSGLQAQQSAALKAAYASAISLPIQFTDAALVTDTYQCDPQSIQNMNRCLSAFRAETLPIGFYWRSATNQNNPFTYADLQGLSEAIAVRGFVSFATLQTKLAAVLTATLLTLPTITW